jgi:hypothetical protein
VPRFVDVVVAQVAPSLSSRLKVWLLPVRSAAAARYNAYGRKGFAVGLRAPLHASPCDELSGNTLAAEPP